MKNFIAIILILMLFLSIFTYKFWIGKPFTFNQFANRVFYKILLNDPEQLTTLRVFKGPIFNYYNNKLTDISKEQNEKFLRLVNSSYKILLTYDVNKLSNQDKITYFFFKEHLQNILKFDSFNYGVSIHDFYPYVVSQMDGLQGEIIEFLVNRHTVSSKKDAKDYIARLSRVDNKIHQIIDEAKFREKKNIIPPTFILKKVIDEIDKFLTKDEKENILYVSFKNKLVEKKFNEKIKKEFLNQALNIIKNKVYPAYLKLSKILEDELKISSNDAGVWKLPNGDEYYKFILKAETTTDFSPQEVHELGLKEVNRIQNEMRNILTELGYANMTIDQAIKEISKDPKFHYPDNENSKDQVIKDFENIFISINDKLKDLFYDYPIKNLKIEAVPAYKAISSPMAYYELPSLDKTRPGIFFINNYNIKDVDKFSMEALAFHEGIPGHHFQISIAQGIKNIAMIRKVLFFNAYVEGWALYCEQLASEANFYKDKFGEIGRLQMELFRAARLVVDTGIHYKHWTRQEAIDYMLNNCYMNKNEIIAEVERYIVLPAQACSYKIGMIKILELRDKMKQRLKDDFDIKKFHDLILKNGGVPLDILEKYVEENL